MGEVSLTWTKQAPSPISWPTKFDRHPHLLAAAAAKPALVGILWDPHYNTCNICPITLANMELACQNDAIWEEKVGTKGALIEPGTYAVNKMACLG